MVYHRVFTRVVVVARLVLADQLHKNILVIQFPDFRLQFQEQVGRRIIAKKQASVSVTDKVLIISKLKVKILPHLKKYGSPVLKIIEGSFLESFVIPKTRNRWKSRLGHPLLKIGGASFLVVRQVG